MPIAGGTADPPIAIAATKSSCTEPQLPPNAAREKGIDALLADRPREAVDLLNEVTRTTPQDRAAEAFRTAANAKLEEARGRASFDSSSVRPIPLEPIPLTHIAHRPVAGAPGKVRLDKASEKRNLITDFADWETNNQLPKVRRRGHDNLPANVPVKLNGERLQTTFVHADHVAAIYGSTILILAEGRASVAFDARQVMARAPRALPINFAQVTGNTLIVELAYNGYASASGGKTGYVAAYDIASGTLSWASEPLVSNAGEIVITGSSVIAGYGFTAEPDFLFVLDLATGKVDQKIPVKSGPEAIRVKGGSVFVRTYDTDYVFRESGPVKAGLPALPAPLAAQLSASGATSTASASANVDPDTRCWVRRATAAILAKDVNGLHDATEALKATVRDRTLVQVLEVEQKKLAQMADGRLDLQAAPLLVAPAPPWQATPAKQPLTTPAPKLVKISSRAADPVRNMHPTFDPTKPWFIAPVEQGKVPQAARADIPKTYGQETLRAIIPDVDDRMHLIYGGRFVATVKADKVEHVLDLEAFRHPPKADPQWKEFAVQDVTHVQQRDGVLYVCNGGGSYAKEVFGKKGFMTAVEATSGKLVWRSAPLVCNSTFVAFNNDHLITGYGFTAEPDFLFVLRMNDGAIMQRVPIESGPNTIELAGKRVHVETYGHTADFDLK